VSNTQKNAPLLISQPRKAIYPKPRDRRSWTEVLMKSALRNATERSQQGVTIGTKDHPFDMVQASLFLTSNTHHAASIKAKQNCTTGLGFLTEKDKAIRLLKQKAEAGMPITEEDLNTLKPFFSPGYDNRSKVARELDPLCDISFQDLLDAVGEDLANTHNGYIEVVRRGENDKITGLHHIPASECKLHVENQTHDYHFEIATKGAPGGVRRFARFGDKDSFMSRESGAKSARGGVPITEASQVSEVIHLRYPSSMSRYYGIPTWLSAVAAIELVQALHQHEFDFYNNRGVPEFLLFLLGKKLDPNEWNALKEVFEAGIGLGNTHKSGAFNIQGEVEVQLEKLAMEGKSDGRFSEMSMALALEIVSGHRIPPLLAGIALPGKLAASNELPNALMAYQTLTVGPDQTTLWSTFSCTLGNKDVNGGLALEHNDFELKTILDVMNLGQMDTVARMRETVPEAQAEGRNIDEGLEKSMDSALTMDKLREVFGALIVQAAEADGQSD